MKVTSIIRNVTIIVLIATTHIPNVQTVHNSLKCIEDNVTLRNTTRLHDVLRHVTHVFTGKIATYIYRDLNTGNFFYNVRVKRMFRAHARKSRTVTVILPRALSLCAVKVTRGASAIFFARQSSLSINATDVRALDVTRAFDVTRFWLEANPVVLNLHNVDVVLGLLRDTSEIPHPCQNKQCQTGAQCVASSDGHTAHCQCADTCPNYGDHVASRPVCGSDGLDYPDKCQLYKHACDNNKNITVKFEGKCDPCADVACDAPEVCQLDHQRTAVCRCGDACPMEFEPVCASDGKTYSNECLLRQEACRSRKSLRIIYRGKCSSGVNPCASVRCSDGEECAINKYGIARCECQPDCEPILRPVCSKDDRTFSSICELRRTACNTRSRIEVAYSGICNKMGPCSEHSCQWGAQCVERNGIAQCECPLCSTEFKPVCGSDGITYSNECKLRKEVCNHRRDIRVLYDGPCDGCENKRCENYSVCERVPPAEAKCVCRDDCSHLSDAELVQVCGTDGVTYESLCHLKYQACTDNKHITVAYSGHCDLCKDIDCKYGAQCVAGECVCVTDCANTSIEPVCASNMITYPNECELRKAACLSGAHEQPLTVIFYGECRERFDVDAINAKSATTTPNRARTTQTVDTARNNSIQTDPKREVCRDIHCDYEATCELGADNFPRCTCKFDCANAAGAKSVCASDLRMYTSICAMKMEACQRQEELRLRPLELCRGMEVKPCNGDKPLVDPVTQFELDCGSGSNRRDCPSGYYCHQSARFAKCCRKSQGVLTKRCEDSWFGCCPDGKTAAQGYDHSGCPSQCGCHRLGSFGDSCDPETGQCNCRPGVGGLKCDRCEPGFWGMPKISSGHLGCIACGCSIFGSVRDDCEQMTGRCVCKPGIQGQKCTVCTDHDKILGPHGCVSVERTTLPPSSCTELNCHYGATCMERKGLAFCECQSECENETPESQQTVCGSDGQTYESECQLKLLACRHQRDIVVFDYGKCPGTNWPGDYTPMQYTQTNDVYNPLSKSTRHLLTPYSKYVYSKHPVDELESNNIDNKYITKINFDLHVFNRPASTTYKAMTPLLGDLCGNNTDCLIPNSLCINGACQCAIMFVDSIDRQTCLEDKKTTEPTRGCASNPCFHDSTCLDLPLATFICVCGVNQTGSLCDEMIRTAVLPTYDVPSFSGHSYISLKPIKAFHKLSLDVELKIYSHSAVILYDQERDDGSGDFISIAVINWHVEFRYNLGNGIVKIVSMNQLERGKYHRISVKTYHRDGLLKIDDNEEVVGFSSGRMKAMDLRQPAYLGYVPLASNVSRVYDNIGTDKGLIGCVKSLRVNHRVVDLHPHKDETIIRVERVQQCSLNPCLMDPCHNGGTCLWMETDNTHTCQCDYPYTGEFCETRLQQCEASSCRNAVCQTSPDGRIVCVCHVGFTGVNCTETTRTTHVTTPDFRGQSFLEYHTLPDLLRMVFIEVWVRPLAGNGLLLYISRHKKSIGDFVTLNLINEHAQFRFNLGSGICNITSTEKLSLNTWNVIRVSSYKRRGTLQVNDGEIHRGISAAPLTELNVEPPLYIGSYPAWSAIHKLSGATKGFIGAIQRVTVNGHDLRVDQSHLCEENPNSIGSCRRHQVGAYVGDPCGRADDYSNPCKNGGVCVPHLDAFKCACRGGFVGRACDRGERSHARKSIKFTGDTYVKVRGRKPSLLTNISDYAYESSYDEYDDDNELFDDQTKKDRQSRFEVRFRTVNDNGVLLWHQHNHSPHKYMAIAIVDGFAEFRLNVHRGFDFWSIRYPKKVNDGEWHTLVVRKQQQIGYVSIDGSNSLDGAVWPPGRAFKGGARTWLGGVPKIPRDLAATYRHGFRGCVESLKINAMKINIFDNVKKLKYCHD